MSHTMKLWGRSIEMRLQKMTRVIHNQFSCMSGRLTMKANELTRTCDGVIPDG